MTFQFPSDVSVSVRETLCALCIAIAQVMRRALFVHVAAHAYVSHRTRCVSRSRRWRSIVSTRRRPLAPPMCVSCVPLGSKVTGFAPGISEPSFVCVSQNPFLLTRATDVAGDTAFSMHVFHVDYSVHD